MKTMIMITLLLAGRLGADQGPQGQPPADAVSFAAVTAAAAPMTATAVGAVDAQTVEQHFQAARRLYLNGDRDGALGELNQALRLDPYHSGSSSLYRSIHDEELNLRQVRLVAPEAAAQPRPAPAPGAGAEAGKSVWRSLLNYEARTNRRLDAMEKSGGALGAEVGQVKAELGNQKELLGFVKEGVRRVEARQDNLMLGLLALLIALIVLLILVIRLLNDPASPRRR